jgi:hypothetical protein
MRIAGSEDHLYHRDCPECGQDDLAIVEHLGLQCLFLWCGECNANWRTPEAVGGACWVRGDDTKSLANSRAADESAIRKYGWERYRVYRFGETIFDGCVPSDQAGS